LRLADCVTVHTQAEVRRCWRWGVSPDRVVPVPPAVACSDIGDAATHLPGVPDGARLLVGVGRLERHKGFRNAVWALDILSYLFADLHLLLVGDGPEAVRVRQFARVTRLAERVHLVGRQQDVAPFLRRADLVWAPALADGSTRAVLEAMAAGRPVVASRLPSLADVVAEGETGVLVPPGDAGALARRTRVLLDDAAGRRRLGEAARRRAAECFSVDAFINTVADLYERGSQAVAA
jgi:glycosyltransferase involved in cell wall biosynthesis